MNKDLSEKRVIIVGNSPSVLLEENGELIDSYDVVIRVNNCPTSGYEKFIGQKFNIWATTNTKTFNFLPKNFESLSEIWHRTSKTKERSTLPKQQKSIKQLIMYKTADFSKHFGELLDKGSEKTKWMLRETNQEPCTGLLTILTSTLFFKDVTITGFTFYTDEDSQQNSNYSYYRKDQLDVNGKHYEDTSWEANKKLGFVDSKVGEIKKEIVKNLIQSGSIKLLNVKSEVASI